MKLGVFTHIGFLAEATGKVVRAIESELEEPDECTGTHDESVFVGS
ncbi:hypothetical protein MUO14_17835 [Halobacillus shinanisalinarum]|uniref:Uncharacterized protein n=1 Tax=Halobacillus shinanisalinarum TaxID=2932258 RepID=A0ABY4GW21_9BACI|nr:hypothetical protein [Halobacillus shinanisalinarum]UOQ92318.1 hypothetical protein MUO14_17835 [Halobacillus shinanisalinarum]